MGPFFGFHLLGLLGAPCGGSFQIQFVYFPRSVASKCSKSPTVSLSPLQMEIRAHTSRSLRSAATPPPVSLSSRAVSQPCLIIAISSKYRLPDYFSRNSRCLEIRVRDLHFNKCPRKILLAGKFEKLGLGFPLSPRFFPEGTSPVAE